MNKPLATQITEARELVAALRARERAAQEAYIAAQRERRIAQFRLIRLEQQSALEWSR